MAGTRAARSRRSGILRAGDPGGARASCAAPMRTASTGSSRSAPAGCRSSGPRERPAPARQRRRRLRLDRTRRPRPARPRRRRRPGRCPRPSTSRPSACAAPSTPTAAASSSPGPPRLRSARPAARAIGPTTDGAASSHSRATRGTPTSQTKLGSPSLPSVSPARRQRSRSSSARAATGRSVATPPSAPSRSAAAPSPASFSPRALWAAQTSAVPPFAATSAAASRIAVRPSRRDDGQLECHDVAREAGQLGESLDAPALVVRRRGGGKDQDIRRCAGGSEQWQRRLRGERDRVLVASRDGAPLERRSPAAATTRRGRTRRCSGCRKRRSSGRLV